MIQPLGYLVFYGAYKAHPILAVQMFGNKAANKLPTSPVVLPRGKVSAFSFLAGVKGPMVSIE